MSAAAAQKNEEDGRLQLEVIREFDFVEPEPTKSGGALDVRSRYYLKLTALAQGGEETAPLPLDVVISVDVSGSMEPENRLPIAVETAKAVIRDIGEDARDDATESTSTLGIVSFATTVKTVLPPAPVTAAFLEEALDSLDSLEAHGRTDLFGAVIQSIAALPAVRSPSRRACVLLLSDGWHTSGTFSRKQAIAVAQEAGVAVHCIGLSDDHDKESLWQLATHSGGKYFGVMDPERMANIVAEVIAWEQRVAASNVCLRVSLIPTGASAGAPAASTGRGGRGGSAAVPRPRKPEIELYCTDPYTLVNEAHDGSLVYLEFHFGSLSAGDTRSVLLAVSAPWDAGSSSCSEPAALALGSASASGVPTLSSAAMCFSATQALEIRVRPQQAAAAGAGAGAGASFSARSSAGSGSQAPRRPAPRFVAGELRLLRQAIVSCAGRTLCLDRLATDTMHRGAAPFPADTAKLTAVWKAAWPAGAGGDNDGGDGDGEDEDDSNLDGDEALVRAAAVEIQYVRRCIALARAGADAPASSKLLEANVGSLTADSTKEEHRHASSKAAKYTSGKGGRKMVHRYSGDDDEHDYAGFPDFDEAYLEYRISRDDVDGMFDAAEKEAQAAVDEAVDYDLVDREDDEKDDEPEEGKDEEEGDDEEEAVEGEPPAKKSMA